MILRRVLSTFALCALILPLILTSVACDREDERGPLQISTDPVVFEDEFDDTIFEPFGEAFVKQDAVSLARSQTYDGSAGAIRIDVAPPADGITASGGAFTCFTPRDLRGYNVLSFWIKATANITMDTIGFGEGNDATSIYQAQTSNLTVTTEWQNVLLPIPNPNRLRVERGMLFFFDSIGGADPVEGYSIFIDDVTWATRGGVEITSAQIPSSSSEAVLGTEVPLETANAGPFVRFDVQGTARIMNCRPFYFDYFDAAENDPPVVDFSQGEARVVGGGTAEIRATVQDVLAAGTLTITSTAPPSESAPAPGIAAADVISVFSDRYESIDVASFRPVYGAGNFALVDLGGDEVLAYTALSGPDEIYIDFSSSTIDASGFDRFRVDVWFPDFIDAGGALAGPLPTVRINDFGPDGVFTDFVSTIPEEVDPENENYRDDSSGRIRRALDPEEELIPVGQWYTLDFRLDDFNYVPADVPVDERPTLERGDLLITPPPSEPPSMGLSGRSHVAQLGFNVNNPTIFLDNIIFYRSSPEGE